MGTNPTVGVEGQGLFRRSSQERSETIKEGGRGDRKGESYIWMSFRRVRLYLYMVLMGERRGT